MRRNGDKQISQNDGFASESLTGALGLRQWQNSDACVADHRAAVPEKDTVHVKRSAHGAKREKKQLSTTLKHEVVLRDDDRSSRALEITPYTRSTQQGEEGVVLETTRPRAACESRSWTSVRRQEAPRTTGSVKEQGDSTRRAEKVPENNPEQREGCSDTEKRGGCPDPEQCEGWSR